MNAAHHNTTQAANYDLARLVIVPVKRLPGLSSAPQCSPQPASSDDKDPHQGLTGMCLCLCIRVMMKGVGGNPLRRLNYLPCHQVKVQFVQMNNVI